MTRQWRRIALAVWNTMIRPSASIDLQLDGNHCEDDMLAWQCRLWVTVIAGAGLISGIFRTST